MVGRTRVYEAIVKGEPALQAGTPESFNVLVKELQSLALDVVPERRFHLAARELMRSPSKKEDRKEKAKEKLGII